MSLQEKMIIPLLDNEITKEDILSSSFSGFYNYDVNNPQLDNNIFLLFKYKLNNESVLRDKRFLKSPNLYKSEFVTINKDHYVLYTFVISNMSIKHIMDNSMILSDKDLIKIYKFWNFCDEDINKYCITNKVNNIFKDSKVPEFDFTPNWEDIFKINE